jgi:hypothetical protein
VTPPGGWRMTVRGLCGAQEAEWLFSLGGGGGCAVSHKPRRPCAGRGLCGSRAPNRHTGPCLRRGDDFARRANRIAHDERPIDSNPAILVIHSHEGADSGRTTQPIVTDFESSQSETTRETGFEAEATASQSGRRAFGYKGSGTGRAQRPVRHCGGGFLRRRQDQHGPPAGSAPSGKDLRHVTAAARRLQDRNVSAGQSGGWWQHQPPFLYGRRFSLTTACRMHQCRQSPAFKRGKPP